ncbi:uncharacterized protein At4g15970-like isoform X2 [Ziziphus jujuba]|uniref:Uncharacterized protein At4g15970-like isoform X2 n=1 Tax=Ziziphus jujuba TaxID=326968 RepID=A0A6P6G5A5_ZIZJJ|nr:uncharacterized protein At4g15970-like isoform X2 [Ziziphus jujuba]
MDEQVGSEVDRGINNREVLSIVVVFLGMLGAFFVFSNYSLPTFNYLVPQEQVLSINTTTITNTTATTTNTTTTDSLEGMIKKSELDIILEKASTEDKTVIFTNLNDAWAEPNSIFDVFLESFRIGNNTQKLLNHLVVICLDEKAYNRCLASHTHCYRLRIEGFNFTSDAFFMTPHYLEIVWRKIEFLATVLEKGFSFVFTDTDIMWLGDPFSQFDPDADIQTSCDMFFGNSSSINNLPNTGFNYAKSNNRTIQFYKFWYNSRETYPNLHDQDAFKKIINDSFINEIGLKLGFLNTAYFGGFCQPSRDLRLVRTMHANCCVGLQRKINDLHILLDDWRKFMSLDPSMQQNASWSIPQYCRNKNSSKGNKR